MKIYTVSKYDEMSSTWKHLILDNLEVSKQCNLQPENRCTMTYGA